MNIIHVPLGVCVCAFSLWQDETLKWKLIYCFFRLCHSRTFIGNQRVLCRHTTKMALECVDNEQTAAAAAAAAAVIHAYVLISIFAENALVSE
jgi:hypothetical protein